MYPNIVSKLGGPYHGFKFFPFAFTPCLQNASSFLHSVSLSYLYLHVQDGIALDGGCFGSLINTLLV